MVKLLRFGMYKAVRYIPILQNGTFFDNADFYYITARCFYYILCVIEKQFTVAIMSILRQHSKVVKLVGIIAFLRERHIPDNVANS